MNRNASLLSSDGDSGIKVQLTSDWAKSLLNRMGYVKRKACSKTKVDVAQFEQLKDEFLLEIKTIVRMDNLNGLADNLNGLADNLNGLANNLNGLASGLNGLASDLNGLVSG